MAAGIVFGLGGGKCLFSCIRTLMVEQFHIWLQTIPKLISLKNIIITFTMNEKYDDVEAE